MILYWRGQLIGHRDDTTRMRPDFDEAPDRRAICRNAMLVTQDLRDFPVALPQPAQITDDFPDRLKLALKRFAPLEFCVSRHATIEAPIIGRP